VQGPSRRDETATWTPAKLPIPAIGQGDPQRQEGNTHHLALANPPAGFSKTLCAHSGPVGLIFTVLNGTVWVGGS